MNQHLLLTSDALVLLCCAGKNDKLKPAQAKQYVARPGLLGLGAEPVPQAEKKERRFIRSDLQHCWVRFVCCNADRVRASCKAAWGDMTC